MSKLRPIRLDEFLSLIEFAQELHSSQNEPIPQVFPSQYSKIKACLDAPFMGFGGHPFYRGFALKAGLLFYLLNKNHPLANGNKRMACLCLGYFCAKNGYKLNIAWPAFYEIAIAVVESDPAKMELEILTLEDVIKKYTKKIPPKKKRKK